MKVTKLFFIFCMLTLAVAAKAQMVLQYDIATVNTEIGLLLDGTVNVQVDWGDGSSVESHTFLGYKSHIYRSIGTKTVTITGTLTEFGSNPHTNPFQSNARLTKVLSWDGLGLRSLSYAFFGAYILEQVPTSLPTNVTDVSYMFASAYKFNQPIGNWNTASIRYMAGMFAGASKFNQPIGNWNTSAVIDMSEMFGGASEFNQPIGNWNTSAVTTMKGMFREASIFNQSIETWNTSAVMDMSEMFYNAFVFNQPIGNWNTSAVTTMSYMFGQLDTQGIVFNQPIDSWNTGAVTDMGGMFSGAYAFNQPINSWNTAAVTDMSYMFSDAYTFNQPINSWNTAAVTNMGGMFSGASTFNQPIGNWNTAAVWDMSYMFNKAYTFNQPIGSWNTSQVMYMYNMFSGASSFNQRIGSWNTAAVKNMSNMFNNASAFNQSIENWNTAAVTNMNSMFSNTVAFNQPISNWNITSVANMSNMFLGAGLCTYNYDAVLNGWSIQAVKTAVSFDGGGSKYSALNANARAMLISKGWVITDGGQGITSNPKCADTSYYNIIRGTIYTDANADCINQGTEKRLSSVLIKAMPGSYYGYTDSNGNYEVRVDTGTFIYTLTQQYNGTNAILLLNQCATSHNISLKGASIDTASFDFANEVRACTLPTVDIQHTVLVRCRRSNAIIQYCNLGNTSINNAVIKVEYPAHLIPISSVPMWTSKVGFTLVYDIGMLQETTCSQIKIIDSVDCASQSLLGLTQCVKVSITPTSTCISQSTLWDFSSTAVVGKCENNQAAFVLTNTGVGNMADSLEYRIFVNDTLIYNGKYKLLSGSTLNVRYPAQGQTVRLEADQHTNHPGNSHPKAIVERCGISPTGFVPKGLVTTNQQDDLDNEVAIVCYPIRGSYDPNDKQPSPKGLGLTHQVAPGTELDYTIRFQNTGTATAYTVIIVDTLDTDLDVTSLKQGVSSHPYTLTITGKGQAVLTFTFDNINLPDSTSDKLGSNGLVSFKITIPANISLGTVIDNKAYIYFDYNDPIITNNTMHTVGITIPENLSKGSNVQVGNITTGLLYSQYTNVVNVYPNPSEGMITVELAEVSSNMELRITSIVGALQKTIKLNNMSKQEVNLEGIQQGMYLYEVWQNGERKAVGKLQIR
jgi:fimbrial isopeptide formation D2 family protein